MLVYNKQFIIQYTRHEHKSYILEFQCFTVHFSIQ